MPLKYKFNLERQKGRWKASYFKKYEATVVSHMDLDNSLVPLIDEMAFL